MKTASVVKEVSYITKEGVLKNGIIHFLVQFPQDLECDFTPTNIQDMTNGALASLDTFGGGIETKTKIFDAPIKDLHHGGYYSFLTPEQKSIQLQHQVEQNPSLVQLLSSEIKQDDLIKTAQQCFDGPAKINFLKLLTRVLQEDCQETFSRLVNGIKTGFLSGQELICNNVKEMQKMFYGLTLTIAKSRYQSTECPWQDKTFHRVLDELRFCYAFGVGVPKNESMVDLLDAYSLLEM